MSRLDSAFPIFSAPKNRMEVSMNITDEIDYAAPGKG